MTYPTISDLKTFLGVSGTSEDGLLTDLLAGAVGLAERMCGRKFVPSTETRKFRSARHLTERGKRLNLFCDLVSVTTLTNADDVVISASDYMLIDLAAPYYAIRIHSTSPYVFQGVVRDYVTVAGSWGFAACPDAVFSAIVEIAATAYRQRVSGSAPVGVAQGSGVLLAPAALPPLAIKQLEGYRRFWL